MFTWKQGIELTLLAGSVASAVLVAAQLRMAARTAPADARSRRTGAVGRVLAHPWTGFAAVCLLLFANQLLFNVYVLAAHGGNAGFVSSYLPRGWFVLAPDAPLVGWLAARLPPAVIGLLSVSVLRVNAFLELPFTLFAYLATVRLYGAPLHRALLRHAPLAAVSFTVTFCAVEWALRNPWTLDDLAIRAVACAVFAGFFAVQARRAEPGALVPPPGAPRSSALLLALAGTALLGVVVLGMYDLTLLYNLGSWPRHGEGNVLLAAAAALTVLFVALHALESKAPSAAPQSGAGLLFASVLWTFLALFFIPSLPIRYRLVGPVAQAAALALIALAAVVGSVAGVRELRARGFSPGRAALSLTIGLAAGGVLATVLHVPASTREEWLLGKTALLLLPALTLAHLLDGALARLGARR